MIALVDLGTGNLRSVERALLAAGGRDVTVTRDPDVIARAPRVVVPGQGAFGDCARALGDAGGALGDALRSVIARGTPYLGLCLGMQVLFESSEEAPGERGLGVFAGPVTRLHDGVLDAQGAPAKVPHMGWNRIERGPAGAGLPDGEWFYFVHSYACVPADPSVVAARVEHGQRFCAAVARDNVLAVQFHPEKSQRAGLDLLTHWLGDSR